MISALNGSGETALCADKLKLLKCLGPFLSIHDCGIGGFIEHLKKTSCSVAKSDFVFNTPD